MRSLLRVRSLRLCSTPGFHLARGTNQAAPAWLAAKCQGCPVHSCLAAFGQTSLGQARAQRGMATRAMSSQSGPAGTGASQVPGSSAPEPAGPQQGNRLAHEQSPYLLQHKHNPVDWYPWGKEALDRAKAEDKPIFLSVGYATCHWCHVMEHESFEDAETAAIMNAHFINIKVDREERPDVDRVYMTYVQAVSGRGGWPMSVFLTPDLEPLYGGTYYPKQDIMQGGELAMPAFTTVLRRLASLWERNRDDLKAKGTAIMSQLQQAMEEGTDEAGSSSPGEEELAASLTRDEAEVALTECADALQRRFDARLGGFGGAPKFPRPSEINSLLHAHLWTKATNSAATGGADPKHLLHMATFSLDKMADGGMYDHLGGGFHRYSVDEFWHVPHFEKMTYDNPQLAVTYLAAFQLTGDRRYAAVARGVLDYLRRDMTSPLGGVYSAEDADSLDLEAGRKTEGAFYVWRHEEVMAALGPQRGSLFCDAYSLKPSGNCDLSRMSDPHNEFGGKNVPIRLTPMTEVAAKHGLRVDEVEAALGKARQELHNLRASRPRPSLDNKVVAAWNGMAVGAYARASRTLTAEDPPARPCWPVDGVQPQVYLEAAQAAAKCLRDHLWDPSTHTLRRAYTNGPSAVSGFADDYAQVVAGLLDLYEAGGGREWLAWASQLQAAMDTQFWDREGRGGYWSTTGDDPSIKLRIKDEYDGAEPTASSMAAQNLYRLAGLLPGGSTGRTGSSTGVEEGDAPLPPGAEYERKAARTLAAFRERLLQVPLALPQMCVAAHLRLCAPLRQVIVASAPGTRLTADAAAQALINAVHTPFAPDKVVVLVDQGDGEDVAFWRAHNPAALAMVESHYAAHPSGSTMAFICQNYTCQAPTADPSKVKELLGGGGGSGAAPKPQPMTVKLPGM